MKPTEKDLRIQAIYDAIRRDPHYRTPNMGSVFVPGVGSNEGTPAVFIGEAPGRDEEAAQRPFVGAAGHNLDTLLAEAGIPRDGIFITNLVKYRPVGPNGENRSPTAGESAGALPWLLEELAVLEPRFVVCLGLSSAKALLGDTSLKMGTANGKIFHRDGLKVLVTYHPSPYNYRMPDKRAALSEAFRRLAELFHA